MLNRSIALANLKTITSIATKHFGIYSKIFFKTHEIGLDFVDNRGVIVSICFHFVYKKHMVALGEKTTHPRLPSHTRLELILYCLFSLMFV
jgi:hypothetical protein